jgi:hypothetical protein
MTLIPDSIGSLSAYFDHLIGERQQFIRHLEAEHLRGLEVDDKLELDWSLDGKLAWPFALQGAIGITRRTSKIIR